MLVMVRYIQLLSYHSFATVRMGVKLDAGLTDWVCTYALLHAAQCRLCWSLLCSRYNNRHSVKHLHATSAKTGLQCGNRTPVLQQETCAATGAAQQNYTGVKGVDRSRQAHFLAVPFGSAPLA